MGVGGLEGFELDPEWEIEPRTIELLDRLGEGSFGTVFRGRYRGTIVAVKVLNKETDVALGDFRTEIGTLKKISHPNAVQFLGAVTKQKPYMLGEPRSRVSLPSLPARREILTLQSHPHVVSRHLLSPQLISTNKYNNKHTW